MINLKVCLVGDGAVGKTALRERYLGKGFSTNYLMTIGADFALKNITVNKYDIKFQIWDLAGQAQFDQIRSLYYRGSRGVLIVYDITRGDTYKNVINWVTEIRRSLPNIETVPFALLANKVDLRSEAEPNHLTLKQGKKLAESLSDELFKNKMPVPYFETSAKTGENVQKAFTDLASLIIEFT
ncbi:MAG: GTP-binding protein [Candidatus Hodarchaeales archaeon]|jgi:small GTP-binding protein